VPPRWRYKNLELCWYDNKEGIKGLVWSVEPIYLAASVSKVGRNYVVNTACLKGLAAEELESLTDFINDINSRS
jgi:hypothetical protein